MGLVMMVALVVLSGLGCLTTCILGTAQQAHPQARHAQLSDGSQSDLTLQPPPPPGAGAAASLPVPLSDVQLLDVAAAATHRVVAETAVREGGAVYVSAGPRGDDGAAGSTAGAPLKTLGHALLVARSKKAHTIYLDADASAGGPTPHLLAQTLALTPADSGLTITTTPSDLAVGRKATVSGAVPVKLKDTATTTAEGLRVLRAAVPGLGKQSNVTQLFVGGRRAVRARIPNAPRVATGPGGTRGLDDAHTLQYASPIKPCTGHHPTEWGNQPCPADCALGFVFNGSDLNGSWYNLPSVELLVFHSWTASRHRIKSIVDSNNTVLVENPGHDVFFGQYATQGGRRFLVENVREALDAPAEFYFDALREELLYVDDPAAPCATPCVALVPVVDKLISVAGWTTTGQAAASITFSDISLVNGGDGGEARFESYAGGPAAIIAIGPLATAINITRCDLAQGGGNGLLIANSNVTQIVVDSCKVLDLGGEGVSITSQDTADVLITDNEIGNTGQIYFKQPAIVRLKGRSNITVQHNDVHSSSYGGIMIGWEQPGMPTPSPAVFKIRYNHVHDYGMGILSDFGGIYVSSGSNVCEFVRPHDTCSNPTEIFQNLVRNGVYYNYGAEGVYMDEQVASINISMNILVNCGGGAVAFHCGTNQNGTNNIIANDTQQGRPGQGTLAACNSGGNPTWPNISHGFEFKRNIVIVPEQGQLTNAFDDYRRANFSHNCYWKAGGNVSSLRFGNNRTTKPSYAPTWEEWQVEGQDSGSVLADPMLQWSVVARLGGALVPHPASTSPVWALGFTAIDVDKIGPRTKALH